MPIYPPKKRGLRFNPNAVLDPSQVEDFRKAGDNWRDIIYFLENYVSSTRARVDWETTPYLRKKVMYPSRISEHDRILGNQLWKLIQARSRKDAAALARNERRRTQAPRRP